MPKQYGETDSLKGNEDKDLQSCCKTNNDIHSRNETRHLQKTAAGDNRTEKNTMMTKSEQRARWKIAIRENCGPNTVKIE